MQQRDSVELQLRSAVCATCSALRLLAALHEFIFVPASLPRLDTAGGAAVCRQAPYVLLASI